MKYPVLSLWLLFIVFILKKNKNLGICWFCTILMNNEKQVQVYVRGTHRHSHWLKHSTRIRHRSCSREHQAARCTQLPPVGGENFNKKKIKINITLNNWVLWEAECTSSIPWPLPEATTEKFLSIGTYVCREDDKRTTCNLGQRVKVNVFENKHIITISLKEVYIGNGWLPY